MRPPWKLMYGLLLVVAFMAGYGHCKGTNQKPEPPRSLQPTFGYAIRCHKAGCTWDAKQADNVYWYVTQAVAKEVSLGNPPKLEPAIELQIGGCRGGIFSGEGYYIRFGKLEACLDSWDAKKWAQAVGVAAATQIIKEERLVRAILSGLSAMEATVSIEMLKEGK